MQKAFTMIELIFVIVVIGILSTVAIPKFSGIADTAYTSKAKSTVASIRSALATERQKRILQGKFSKIVSLDTADTGNATAIFTNIVDEDGDASGVSVFDYSMKSCPTGKTSGCWTYKNSNKQYTYFFPNASSVTFSITNSKFICSGDSAKCNLLTH